MSSLVEEFPEVTMRTQQQFPRKRKASQQGGRSAPPHAYKPFGVGSPRPEYKFLDCAWNAVTINASTDGSSGELQPSSGCTGSLSVPAQGDGDSNRDGRKYTITNVYVSGVVSQAILSDQTDVTDGNDCGYYFALVLDTQANGATIVSENVFINPSTDARAMVPQPLRNLKNSKRFKVLAKAYVNPSMKYAGTDGASTVSVAAQYEPVVTLGWKGRIVCDSLTTTADVVSASDNAIHLIAYATSASFTPTFVGKSRVRFVG